MQLSYKNDEIVDNNRASFDPSVEPLLKENPRRFVILPIEFPDIWQMYKKAEGEHSFLRIKIVFNSGCDELLNYPLDQE